MLGSHNSISYLHPRNFLGYITRPWNKCQNKTLEEQWNSGVRYFDIRVDWINESWHYVHNKIDFGEATFQSLYDFFKSREEPFGIRLCYDHRNIPENPTEEVARFLNLCNQFKIKLEDFSMISSLTYITFWDWNTVHAFSPVNEIEKHVSVSGTWYQYILGTKWFARKFNKSFKETYKRVLESQGCVLMLDYI